jgi:peroxiredoxin
MITPRILFPALLLAGALSAAESTVAQSAARMDEQAAKAPKPLAIEFRLRAAQALKERYPELSRKFADTALADLRAEGWASSGVVQALPQEEKATAATLGGTRPARTPPDPAISKRIGTMRSLPTDADRAKLVLEVTPQIRALPAGTGKLSLIRGLAGVATEGDLGHDALTAVATTLADAMRESYPAMIAAKDVFPYGDPYVELAKLVRYEGIKVPGADPSLDAAGALLELREHIQQEAGFTLTAMDGKTYTLAALKGRIVLLNFWATWCPPCRKEMPDMEKLYRKYDSKGLTVLAVSDEKRETVEGFLAKNPYSFPVLLDPEKKANSAFFIDGIPKSFIFDREGRLAAQAIDMRTETQFMELLKRAGLE